MNDPASQSSVSNGSKGMPVIAWVGVGCGTIIAIGIVCISMLVGFCQRKVGEFTKNPEKVAAEMMVKYNPDLKLVSQDDAKGEMTIRTKDGKEITMSYKDIAQGKLTIKDADGNVMEMGQTDLSKVPSWVPRLEGLKTIAGSVHSQEGNRIFGAYNATTSESAEDVSEHFKSAADKLNLGSSSSSSTTINGVENRVMTYEGDGKKLTLVITAKAGEDTQVNVGYEESK